MNVLNKAQRRKIPTTETNETEENRRLRPRKSSRISPRHQRRRAPKTPHEDSAPSDGSVNLAPVSPVRMSALDLGRWTNLDSSSTTDYDCTPRPLLLGAHAYLSDGYSSTMWPRFSIISMNMAISIFPDAMARSNSEADAGVTSFNDGTSHFDNGPDGPTVLSVWTAVFSQIVVPEEADFVGAPAVPMTKASFEPHRSCQGFGLSMHRAFT